MSDRPVNVFSIADARAARAAQPFTDTVKAAEATVALEQGADLDLREKVLFRNLGYFAERICNPAYRGKFTFKVVRLKISGELAVRGHGGLIDAVGLVRFHNDEFGSVLAQGGGKEGEDPSFDSL